MKTAWPDNCIYGKYRFPDRAVYAQYSNTLTANRPAWIERHREGIDWKPVDADDPPDVDDAPPTQPKDDVESKKEYTDEKKAENEARYSPRKLSLIAHVDAYDKLGLCPIKIPPKAKAPGKGWADQHLTGKTAAGFLDTEDNLGVRFGKPSHGVADLDLDWLETVAAADVLFANLPAYGRPGKPRSHRLVTCAAIKTFKFKLPPSCKADPRIASEHGVDICEFRSTGAQSVVPPSINAGGEQIAWHDGKIPEAFPSMDPAHLTMCMAAVALTALTTRCDPGQGDRYNTLVAFAGAMLRIINDVGTVDKLIGVVCKGWNATPPGAALQTGAMAEKLATGDVEVTGLPTLLKHLGLPDDVAKHINSDWLMIKPANVDDGRRVVLISPTTLNTNIENIEAALIEANADIYQRGGQLVETYRLAEKITDEDGVTRPKNAIGIHGVEGHRLLQIMDTNIRFTTMTKAGPATFPPPNHLAPHVAAHIKEWGFRPLNGIIEAPTLRNDGTILQVAGYDKISGLLFDAGGATFPTIPENPTKEDAIVALKVCTDMVAEYPFVLDDENAPHGAHDKPCASRSAALAIMFTALVRRQMDRAPVEGIDANSISSGKSHLCDLISIIVTGREAAVMSLPPSDEEAAKVILSVLMNGDPVVVIDNVLPSQAVGGAVLSSIVTQSSFKGRVLGASKMVEVPTNVTILINGNNLVFAADMSSRAIKSRLNAGLENPDTRKFSRDLHAYTKEHRGEIIVAILTILRAYIVAGRPARFTPSRFPQWDSLARGALVWLDQPDPQLTRVDIDAVDPERSDLGSLLEAFEQCFGAKPVTSKQICDHIHGSAAGDAGRALHAALAGLTKDGQVTTRQVTSVIRQRSEKIVGGRQFRCRVDHAQVVHMRVDRPQVDHVQAETAGLLV